MAKIKFNLNFGGEQIRTLDNLRDNFSIEDVLDVYSNGLLVKWLDVHNHKGELEQVNAIHATDARGILTELIRIFGISDNPSEIEESLSVLDYLEERKKVHEDMKAHGITDHEKLKKERDDLARQVEELKGLLEAKAPEAEIHEEAPKPAKKSYDELVREIIDNHLDLHHIYDCLDAITEDYPDILREKHSELFETLHAQRPLTLYALFAHYGTRPYFVLNDEEIKIEPDKSTFSSSKDTRYVIFHYLPHSGYIYDNCEYSKNYIWGVYDGLYHGKEVEALPSVREKLYFINALKVVSNKNFVSEEKDKIGRRYLLDIQHPYLRLFKGIEAHKYTSDDETWHVVEKPDKKFMVFYTSPRFGNDQDGLIASTYTHHLYLRLHHHLDFTLPIFEGIDVKTQKYYDWYRCLPFYYMEAR